MVPKGRFQEPAFDRVEWHRREQFHPIGPNLGVVFVADQLADGSWFRSLTVVDILGLTFY